MTPRHQKLIDWTLWSATALAVPLSFIGGRYPVEQTLQHIPTTVAMIGIGWLIRAQRINTACLLCLLVFAWLHILGARWIYSMVPYDAWAEAITGTNLSDRFGWRRNHYDRLVHFASGVLFVPPAAAWLRRGLHLSAWPAAVLAIAIVMTIAAVYEIAEWTLAVTMSPRAAEAYNGQQGDVWDPQKDMALALGGAIVVVMAKRLWSVTIDDAPPMNPSPHPAGHHVTRPDRAG